MTAIHGFELLEVRDIPEINTRARLFQHTQSGAKLLSLENDDENKSYVIGFQTPPPDDTGLPHILEHSVLCGSRKYNVKDPFVQLLKYSVKTFLNAITFSDMTIYPLASANTQDFYNLVNVYTDAVLFPRISPEILMQEGWHYEIAPEGAETELIYKGVVFNEMKGALSSPDRMLGIYTDRELQPDTPYGLNSGGDPAAMPDLTYEQFKTFHETYYHPSNAFIIFYGDDDPEKRLEIMNEYLSEFEAIEVDASLPTQPRFSEPRSADYHYEVDEPDNPRNKSYLHMSWLLPEITDQRRTLALSILSYALVSTSAAPLRRALLESGLGESLTGGGLQTWQREAEFSVGLKGIDPANADQVEQLILDTLQRVVDEGLDRETVLAALNTTEFRLRERNYGGFPRGLLTAINVLPTWMHGGHPFEVLRFEEDLKAIREALAADETYFEQLIREHLLDNPHRVTIRMTPDASMKEKRIAAEKQRLIDERASMSDEDLVRVREQQATLETIQNTPDDPAELAKIPTLKLADIERNITQIAQETHTHGPAQVYYHEQPTAGVVYFDIGFDLRVLPEDQLPYAELLTSILTRVGTAERDYVQLTQQIGIETGGLDSSLFTANRRDASGAYVAYFMLQGKALADKSTTLLDIMQDVLHNVNLGNRERIKQIVLEKKSSLEQMAMTAGHLLAMRRASAGLDTLSAVDERTSGLSYLFFMRELGEHFDERWDELSNKLREVLAALVHEAGIVVNVTAERSSWEAVLTRTQSMIDSFAAQPKTFEAWPINGLPVVEGLAVPAQVNFNAKAKNLFAHGYELDGSVMVISRIVNMEHMWHHIRVKGGAYGGRMLFSPTSGNVVFLSWRDPNIANTLQVYDDTAQFLQGLEIGPDEIEKAILGAIGDMDGHDLPDARGFKAFVHSLTGYSDDMRQAFRDQVLDTNLDDFRHFGLTLANLTDGSRIVTTGSRDALAKARDEDGIPFEITPVF